VREHCTNGTGCHKPFVQAAWQHGLPFTVSHPSRRIGGNRAKAAYRDFLTLWKDADPDIPILIEAKAEYAKLK